MCKPIIGIDNEFVDVLMIPVTELHERLSGKLRNIYDRRAI